MLYIKELLPNPVGSDEQGEWIRLINETENTLPLGGYKIADKSGRSFSLSSIGNMAPGETIELKRSLTEIALNNDGDTLYLYGVTGDIVDQLSYNSTISEGEIVTAERFIKESAMDANGQSLHRENFGTIDYSPGLTPIVVGLSLALVAGLLAWYITNKEFQKEDEEIYD